MAKLIRFPLKRAAAPPTRKGLALSLKLDTARLARLLEQGLSLAKKKKDPS